ncbi:MAG: NAD(P)/FAD-dependent oxidoreductase, partial [Flavobacteriales bacterium]|nr:NAD(P)/FAD-dependent oxidoreductase [Flavobacteriales bacterium]
MKHIVIIGNGISGITAARHLRKRSDNRITVISAETDHFFSRTALMYIYMGHMKYEHTKPYEDDFWENNRIELLRDLVQSIDYDNKLLKLKDGEDLAYDKLILAVGSKPNKFGWPGQDLDGVQGLYSYQDLQNLERITHAPLSKPEDRTVSRAVIVGGGLIGVELAEMLLTRDIPVTFLVRENRFWGNVLPEQEGELVARHMREHHVDLHFETELKEILSDENGRCRAVITTEGKEIKCQVVGLTAGVSPNIDFLKNSDLKTDRGIIVNRMLETNIDDVYAIGDCAQFSDPPEGRRSIEQVWYTGRMMGETIARTLTGQPTEYAPGFWFNSAKFFDIEYQTYGTVSGELQEGQEEFYWEHVDGKMCIHLIWESNTRKFTGI